ncbi:transcriptional regulator [Streptomyces sp. NPDC020875]|uniref:transcriptional regulator n=1 Tax=Streptomyces sp. NPDC020875 TaxID=3154898 RepID=UPI003405267B
MSIDGHHLHPLSYLLGREGWTADSYLARLDVVHRRLGYGAIARDRKKVTRWTKGVTPDMRTQRAMAQLHGVPHEEVSVRPWPEWLRLACISDRDVVTAAWTPTTTVDLLGRVATGGDDMMERRGFLVVTGISPVLAGAAGAQPAPGQTHGGRVSPGLADLFDHALATLRRQDDYLGAGQVHASARAQLRLVVGTLKTASYSEQTGRRLYAAAAEAARICGWTAYDSGRQALAEEYYVAALRAATSAADPAATANILSYWAALRLAEGDPANAATLVTDALSRSPQIGAPAMDAMLYARLARAHARVREHRSAARALSAAFDAYDRARDRTPEETPDCVYWFNLGELYMQAGSCDLDLGRPDRALDRFTSAAAARDDAYREDEFPRSTAIFLAREAEARMALGDLDGAVESARRAVGRLGGLPSARWTSSLGDLRAKLADHRGVPVVREFLEQTA